MPQDREVVDQPAEQPVDWAAWLVAARNKRGKRPIDLVNAAKARDKKLSTGQITNWESRRNPASPESARLMAELLDEDPVEALRAAGHEDWADFVESQRNLHARASASTDQSEQERFIAKLRASGDPEKSKLADIFETDINRVRRLAELELAELERKKADSAPREVRGNKSGTA